MINLHRNFYVENILKQIKQVNSEDIKNLPYKENFSFPENNGNSLYFIDIDRYRVLKNLETNIINSKFRSSLNLFVLSSKKKDSLDKFEKKINSLNLSNVLILNIYSLGVKKPVELSREKFLHTYLTIETQVEIAKIVNEILFLKNHGDIRLVAFDLDNTTWNGVVGEDGIKKIKLDFYQKKSLLLIDNLIGKGTLFSIHSKNNEKIALQAIKKKLSFYKNVKTKTFKYINWESKLKSIKTVTKLVNFSRKNIIFLDDDMSNIKQVENFLGEKNCFWVKNSYLFYIYVKIIYFINRNKKDNKKRYLDIKSNIKRESEKSSVGLLNYIKSSKLKITFSIKKINYERSIELSNKVNQFNASYKRYKFPEIKKIKKQNIVKVVTFSVRDKYSDSGIIALLVLEKKKNTYYLIKEFVISCRALGRGLENYFLYLILKKFNIKNLSVEYIKTERNLPFIKFAESIMNKKESKKYIVDIVKVNKKAKKYEKWIKTKIN